MLAHKKFKDPLKVVLAAVNRQLNLYRFPTKKDEDLSLIAGGYLRDHVLERDINDIDIYIDARKIDLKNHTYDQLVDKVLEYTTFEPCGSSDEKVKEIKPITLRKHIAFRMFVNGYTIKIVAGSNNYPSASKTNQVHQASASSPNGILSVVTRDVTLRINSELQSEATLQFIFLCTTPLDYIENHFSCDISKIYYNGNKIVMTPEFLNAVFNKRITYVEREYDKSAQFEDYVEKIKEKFPDYSHNVINRPKKC